MTCKNSSGCIVEAASTWVAEFVAWYNEEHRHSGISFLKPGQRHRGVHEEFLEHLEHVYTAAKAPKLDIPSAGPATPADGIATRPSNSTHHTERQMSKKPYNFGLETWKAPSLAEILKKAQDERSATSENGGVRGESSTPVPEYPHQPPNGTLWHIRAGIQPVDLYAYLKARFGAPNGLTMLGNDPDDSDNLIHWHYSIVTSDGTIDFLCFSFRLEVWLSFKCSAEAQDLLRAIKTDMTRVGRELGKVRGKFEKWQLLLNPYVRLKQMIESQLDELESLRLDELRRPGFPLGARDTERFQESFRQAAEKYSTAARIALTVRMLAPVMAESFVNLLLFLLARPEVRGDRRLYQSILRNNIDIRVRALHLHCLYFDVPVAYDEWDACKRFNTMMMGRNDLLHGNIEPRLHAFYDVFFEGNTPLFLTFEDFSFFSYEASMKNAEPEQALADYETVQDFAAHILICLRPSVQDEVRKLVLNREIGWDAARQRSGVLFPEQLIDFHAEPVDSEDDP